MIKYNIAALKASAHLRPDGYVDYMLTRGKTKGNALYLDLDAQLDVQKKFPVLPQPQTYDLPMFLATAEYYPPGCEEFILQRGEKKGDRITLDGQAVLELMRRFPLPTMPLVYRQDDLKRNIFDFPARYLEEVFARGKVIGDYLVVEAAEYSKIRNKFSPPHSQRYKIADLKAGAYQRPPGFVEFALAHGTVDGEDIVIELETQREINRLFPYRVAFKIAGLEASKARRPKGFVEFMLSRGKIEGDVVALEEADVSEFRKRFPRSHLPVPRDPSLTELAANFAGAMTKWAQAGFKTVERATYEVRVKTCLECPNWDQKALGGTGKCKVCGCSKLKLWLATSKCPDKPPRW